MSGVSKNTDIVVCGDKSGSKLAEAEALGVEVWDESDLLKAFSKGGGKTKATSTKKAPPAKKAKVAKKKSGGKKGVFAGKKFCITGTLGLMTRKVAQAKIMKAGGEVVAKPSKNVDYMIVGDDAGGKEDTAIVLDLECWDEEEFVCRLEGVEGYEASESSEESEEESEDEEPSPPPAKSGGGTSASTWDTFVKNNMFSGMRVRANGTDYPLRPDQKAELKKWTKGTWDSSWLVVKSGIPRYFVASDGAHNELKLKV